MPSRTGCSAPPRSTASGTAPTASSSMARVTAPRDRFPMPPKWQLPKREKQTNNHDHRDLGKNHFPVAPLTRSSVAPLGRSVTALPEHLPRVRIEHAPACTCPDCGAAMRKIGEDVSEVLDYVPARFRVIRRLFAELTLSLMISLANTIEQCRNIVDILDSGYSSSQRFDLSSV